MHAIAMKNFKNGFIKSNVLQRDFINHLLNGVEVIFTQ